MASLAAAVAVLIAVAPFSAALTTDGLSLLAFKFALATPSMPLLSSWRDSDADPCRWLGVTCDNTSSRVAAVSLPGLSLSGYLPSELSLLTALRTLSLPRNRLAGALPPSLAALSDLESLDLSSNRFSGAVPPTLATLQMLRRLDLSDNLFNGSLPLSLPLLPRLAGVLNLSFNHFSGPVPPQYGSLPVAVSLDLRSNNLSGEIPQLGSLLNQGPTAFAGNPALCGFPLRTQCAGGAGSQPRMPTSGASNPAIAVDDLPQGKRPSVFTPPVIVIVAVVLVGVVALLVLQWQLRRRCIPKDLRKSGDAAAAAAGAKPSGGSAAPGDRREHEGELFVAVDEGFALELEELLRASAYVVGKSRSGIVYRVVPARGGAVAVRRLSEPDDACNGVNLSDALRRRRAFEAEAAAIGRARHPNVVRLRAYYYAPDEKLLVYDYISNGTLHSALHYAAAPSPSPFSSPPLSVASPPLAPLSWAARLSIVQGAARGLAFLHECSPRRYVHGCVKSSKILLDDELKPYVSGFGLTRLAAGSNSGANKRSDLANVAPELRASAAATQKGDVYSFGVVLLEVVTGRGAGAGEGDGELEGYVRRAFREERPLSDIVDPALLHEVQAKKQVLAVFHVALGCTEADPEARPRMRAVADSLDRISQ